MKNCIGIRRENKDILERRSPLTPRQVAELVRDEKMRVIVQSASNRIYSEEEYRRAGAQISDDLSPCNIVFGVKEVPEEDLLPTGVFCYFSHTIKGQEYNMPLLAKILERKITLMDYELVTDEQGKRQIFFGRFAGIAGMLDALWVYGQRLSSEGIENPLQFLKQTRHYGTLRKAEEHLQEAAERIKAGGFPQEAAPVIIGITGRGHVAQGAHEVLSRLPVEELSPRDLLTPSRLEKLSPYKIYKVVFLKPEIYRPRDAKKNFDADELMRRPDLYEGNLEQYLPALSIFVNGIFWEPRFPKFLTRDFLRRQYQQPGRPKMKVIADITCDINGSVEATVKATRIDNPVYVYQPRNGQVIDGWEGEGPVVLAVDKLPTELPREASENFGRALMPAVPLLAKADFSRSYEKLDIPESFRRAVIAHQGKLTPDFQYLREFLAGAASG